MQGYGAAPNGKVSAAMMGTAIHAGLEAHFKGENWRDGIHLLTGEWEDKAKAKKVDAATAAFLQSYRSTTLFADWTVVDTEKRLKRFWGTYGGYNVYITGAFDMLMRDMFDSLHCIDHKTVSDFRNITNVPYKRSAYVYDWLIEDHYGERIDSFIFNIIHRDKLTEAPRYEVVTFNDALRGSFLDSLDSIVKDIVNVVTRESNAYPNPSKDCSWKCPFYRVCPVIDKNPDMARDTLDTHFRDTDQETIFQITKENQETD